MPRENEFYDPPFEVYRRKPRSQRPATRITPLAFEQHSLDLSGKSLPGSKFTVHNLHTPKENRIEGRPDDRGQLGMPNTARGETKIYARDAC